MRVLITGGNGFIGENLNHKLQGRGAEVILITREQWDGSDNFLFLNNLLSDGVESTFVHLAAIADVKVCEEDYELCKKVNIDQLENLLENLIMSNISNFLFASSMAVYGDTVKEVVSESAKLSFNSRYGESKIIGENLLREWSLKNNKTALSFRIANLYGFRVGGEVHNKGVVSYLIRELGKGERVTLEVSNTTYLPAKRDFVNVLDCVDLLIRGIFYKEYLFETTLIEGKYNSFNISQGEGIEILKIALFLAKYFKFKGSIAVKLSDNIFNGVGANDKAWEVFNWRASHLFFEDLISMADSYRGKICLDS
jgi:UDP-glucose 4-epimerase